MLAVLRAVGQTFVSDDGFQSPDLCRTQQVVVHNPLRRDDVVPNGCLREGTDALERADLRWAHLPTICLAERVLPLTNYEVVSYYAISDLVTTMGERLPLSWLNRRTVLAACGIGQPDSLLPS